MTMIAKQKKKKKKTLNIQDSLDSVVREWGGWRDKI